MNDYYWALLSVCTKLAFAFAPKLVRETEFNLGTHESWMEAKDVATVSACRGILASLPILLVFQTYSATEKLCAPAGVTALPAMVIGVLLLLVTWRFLRTPVGLLRVKAMPFVLVGACTILEALYAISLKDQFAKMLCA